MVNAMIAIAIREPGGPEVLVPVKRDIPQPGAGEVLIKVDAAGVNRPDVMQRQGHYAPPPGASDIPGLDVAGTIAALGDGVESWSVGDRVCALLAGGGYAEYAVAPAPQCLPIPAGLDFAHAAALPEVMFTVWTNVFERGHLAAGETLLVHGGASGIGTAAIQLARARGARVFATAGSDAKCRACEALGAECGINYRETDFVTAIKEHTGGRGVDVVLDMVGGDYLQRNIDVLAVDGRLVQIAQLGGYRSTINTIPILQRRLTITGSTLRSRSVEEKGRIASAVREHVWPLIESGAVQVVIHQRFPLAQAADAHRVMESSVHVGKLILQYNRLIHHETVRCTCCSDWIPYDVHRLRRE
ncbi:MAG: NAD(P)H-quinone oxidoreductase [Vicinamibacterales bacterium]